MSASIHIHYRQLINPTRRDALPSAIGVFPGSPKPYLICCFGAEEAAYHVSGYIRKRRLLSKVPKYGLNDDNHFFACYNLIIFGSTPA